MNARLRARWGRRFADEARGPALEAGAEERIWRGIEERLTGSPSALPRLRDSAVAAGQTAAEGRKRGGAEGRTRGRGLPFLATAFTVAAALALYLALPRTTVSTGIKGPAKVLPQLTSLRYAVVGKDGQIAPGHDGMSIAAGTYIVFSVESRDVAASGGLDVALDYAALPAPRQRLVPTYKLAHDREILTGPDGYIAFAPPSPGTYVFSLATAPEGALDEEPVSFTLHVAP